MITWITETVAIGELSDVTLENLDRENVTWIINLIEMTKARIKNYHKVYEEYANIRGAGLSWMPLTIDPEKDLYHFQRRCKVIVKELFRRVLMGKRVLIHCIAGMDRAPFIVALLLGLMVDLTYTKPSVMGAYAVIKQLRPQTIEHFEWLEGW